MKLNYYTTTEIHLSLEDFHNAGLRPHETREIIENISIDRGNEWPHFKNKLFVRQSNINNNWTVRVSTTNQYAIENIVFDIEMKLKQALSLKKVI